MSLKDFLAESEGEPAAVQPPGTDETPAPAPEPEAQAPEPTEEPEAKAPEEPQAKAEPADPEPEFPEDVRGLRAAVQGYRKERSDYKGQADQLRGQNDVMRAEMDKLRADLEAIRKAPPAAPVVAPPPSAPEAAPEPEAIPNVLEDPQGYHSYMQRQTEQRLFNERLNMSEAILRMSIGNDDVDAKLEIFKKAVAANPALRVELGRQQHPWQWMYTQAQRIAAMEEIGTDPNAFRQKTETELRAKLETELREKIQAEYAAASQTAAAAAPAPEQRRVTLPQSLGAARSSAPRMEAETAPSTLEEIFPVHRRRKE